MMLPVLAISFALLSSCAGSLMYNISSNFSPNSYSKAAKPAGGSVEEWVSAISDHTVAVVRQQLQTGPINSVNHAKFVNDHFIFVLNRAVEAAEDLANKLLTREQALEKIDDSYETLNGTVQVNHIHGNLTIGSKWFAERKHVTKVADKTRRWFDIAHRTFDDSVTTIVQLNTDWIALIDTLRQVKDEDYEAQISAVMKFLASVDAYQEVSFFSGVRYQLDAFAAAFEKEKSHEFGIN